MPPLHDPSPYQYPYPPIATNGNPSPYGTASTATSATLQDTPKDAERSHMLARTPSPTPSEERALKTSVLDWKTLSNWRFWIRRQWLWYYVALVIILVVTALVTIFHKQIVHWLTPVTRWLHDLKFGWLVPIGVLFVISFPPLFGHEIVAILCGLVWGLWVGFGIVSAGTFLGEVGNFYAFKYCCRARGEKLERTNITYACLAQVVREGGFKIALIARLSAIPGHFTTAVFSTCGMGIIVFSLAAILSMPKQFITVYLGVILEQSSTGVKDKKSTIISDVVLGITIVITFLAMWYIYRQMNKVKSEVVHARRKARQAKLARAGFSPYSNNATSSTVTFDPYSPSALDDDSIPLKVQAPSVDSHSQDDSHNSNGPYGQRRYDPHQGGPDTHFLYAPQPRKGGRLPIPNPDDADEGVGHVEYGYGRPSSSSSSSGDERNLRGHGYGYGHGHGHGHGTRGRTSEEDVVGWDMRGPPMQHTRQEDMYGYRVDATTNGNLSTDTLQGGGGPAPVAYPPRQQQQQQQGSSHTPVLAPVPGPARPTLPSSLTPAYASNEALRNYYSGGENGSAPQPLPPPQSRQGTTPVRTDARIPGQSQNQNPSYRPPFSPPPPPPQQQPTQVRALPPPDNGHNYNYHGYGHGLEPTDASYRTARERSSPPPFDDHEEVYTQSAVRAGMSGSPAPPSYRTNLP